MKKLSKLMALLLSLLMILSLFAACGDDKKGDGNKADAKEENSTLTGEALLVGTWEASFPSDYESIPIIIHYTFEKDGTFRSVFTEEAYNNLIEQTIELFMSDPNYNGPDFNYEEMAELGYNIDGLDKRELTEIAVTMFYDYNDLLPEFEGEGTWTLDNNQLTLNMPNASPTSATATLTDGKTSFALVWGDSEYPFTKNNV